MKVLIVSASVGTGHLQAAKALANALAAELPEIKIVVTDVLSEEGFMGSVVREGYLKMLSMAPYAYDRIYRMTDRRSGFADFGDVMELSMLRTMRRIYRRHLPDMMIFTHPFPCAGAAFLKRHHMMNIPCAAVLTDFVAHRLWLYEEIDYYFAAEQSVAQTIEAAGIAPNRIFTTGIPIRPGFMPRLRSEHVTKGQPLSLLLMGGGLGLGEVTQTVQALTDVKAPLDIMVAAGRNGALRRDLNSIKRHFYHPLKVYGYTDQIHVLMQAADLLITKPGGLTCSEALAAGLPMVLSSALPGQEQDNAIWLTGLNAAVRADSPGDTARKVAALADNPSRLEAMRRAAFAVGKPHAANAVAQHIAEILERPGWYQTAN